MTVNAFLDVLAMVSFAGWGYLAWRGLGALARAMNLTRAQTLAWLVFLGWLFAR